MGTVGESETHKTFHEYATLISLLDSFLRGFKEAWVYGYETSRSVRCEGSIRPMSGGRGQSRGG